MRNVLCNVFLFFVISFPVTPAFAESRHHRVLFISSYHSAFPTFDSQIGGLRDAFSGEGVILDIETMDSERFSEDGIGEKFREMLSMKLHRLPPYDLVITADDPALIFFMKYRDELFKDLPLVFFGVEDIGFVSTLDGDPLITGMTEEVSMKDTLKLMSRLRPEAEEFTAISDRTAGGLSELDRYYSFSGSFPEYSFEHIDLGELSWADLEQRLGDIGPGTAVLLLSAYADRNDERKLFPESLELICSSLGQPLFHLWYPGMGDGVLGGRLVCMYDQAADAARLGLRIIDGEAAGDIEIERVPKNNYFFDYDELRRFSISLKALPAGSRVINTPPSFELLKSQLMKVVFGIVAGLIIAAAVLGFANLRINRIKRRLHESEAKYKALFHESRSVMMIIDPENGRIADANSAAAEYYGYPLESLREMSVKSINTLPPEDTEAQMEKASEAKKQIFSFKHRLRSGRTRDVEVYTGPVKIKGRRYLYSIVHDVTEKNEYFRAVEKTKIEIEKALRIKNDFLANMSHELKSPLNGIKGMLGLLGSAGFSEQERAWHSLAVDAVENLNRLIEDLLLHTQQETGRVAIIRDWFSIGKILSLAGAFGEGRAADRGLKLEVVRNYRSEYFWGDEVRTLQVMNNLLTNAIKYSDRGTVRIEAAEEGDNLVLTVSDQGEGIPEEKLELIFEPFTQLESGEPRKKEGLGLGLSIVRNIIDGMEGLIDVESGEGEGTVFRILIPGRFRAGADGPRLVL